MLLGKRVNSPSPKAIEDFKTLVKHSGLSIGPKDGVLHGSQDLVNRLKLLIGHQKSGGNNKQVKKEVAHIATQEPANDYIATRKTTEADPGRHSFAHHTPATASVVPLFGARWI